MGDAYRYTIQPIFQNIRTEYQCHIKYKPNKVLYTVTFFVEVDEGRSFRSEEKVITVYSRDLAFQTQGEFQLGYINVEHSIGLDLKPEMILKGFYDDQKRSWYNHSVYSLKSPEEYDNKRVVVHEISSNIYVASVQFTQPFDYSTSSWGQNDNCDKNVSKFKSLQKQHLDDEQTIAITADRENRHPNTPVSYSIMSNLYDPRIVFSVPGNELPTLRPRLL
jgi:hypothetical protein